MISEKEYRLSIFEHKFEKLKGKKIALYGTAINARAVVNRFDDIFHFVCFIENGKAVNRVICDKLVLSIEQAIQLGVEHIIIAAKIDSCFGIYKRIWQICKTNGITVWDMYGNDMSLNIMRDNESLVKLAQGNENKLRDKILQYDWLCVQLTDTLFAVPYLQSFRIDFWKGLEAYFEKNGLTGSRLAETICYIENQKVKTVFEKIHTFFKIKNIAVDQQDVYIKLTEKYIIDQFKIRTKIKELLSFANSIGKKICVFDSDDVINLDLSLLKLLLHANDIPFDEIVSIGGPVFSQYDGLVREMLEVVNGKALIISCGSECGMINYITYGLDMFRIASCYEYNQMHNEGVFAVNEAFLDEYENRKLFVAYLQQAYADCCFLSDVSDPSTEVKSLFAKISSILSNYGGKNATTYKPHLLEDINLKDSVEQYEKLEFKQFEKPDVSIIIPVYNQFGYTYNCLKAILLHSEEVKYEIIIADDCSTDQVSEMEKVVSGIRVIHNQNNLKFLLNCNHAAKYARGRYILFLNNDTQVQDNWLKPLLDTMKKDNKIGMVGSKLVYPNGRLQEAGGILWKDGSAWNYGHLADPNAAEYCYCKECDYISGASIMIRKELWDEIGGFDERYTPAYYEDTDLAFEVRKHGYKVVLQPKSVVVHFEGISNGTDVSGGIKAYQVANKGKFFEKWKDILEKEHFNNAENVYLAKDRGQFKKQILVVDHYVPNYDKDAGGRCTYMYLKMFLKMGLKVTFIGDNFATPQPYTDELNELGIEILYGDYYASNWQEWLRSNLQYFDYVYLQRPHISIKYIDIVKEYFHGKIFYFAHDLHHVRLAREYEITKDESTLRQAREWEQIELKLFNLADVGHVVGTYEQQVMEKRIPGKVIRNIPLYIYEDIPKVQKDFALRKDLIFVGGFGHTPNIDAVLWFANEVMPKIVDKYPDIVWHIVGNKAPAQVQELACKNIVFEGFVTDERLAELYNTCRMAVVPLRYGAGVKGKVVEASYYQIPLVTTSIGAEGLDDSIGAFQVEDDADAMAKLICSLYEDYTSLKKMSDAGERFIHTYFTEDVARETLLQDM